METIDNMCCVVPDIPTPCLFIDENRLEKNIGRIHDYAARHEFMVRPHVKTHLVSRNFGWPYIDALLPLMFQFETI